MKAIQIKILPATNTKPTRLKAFTEAGSIIEPFDYEDVNKQTAALAKRYCEQFWPGASLSGPNCLPNGDWIFTLQARDTKP